MENKKVLLSVKDLHVKFRVRGRILTAIRGVSLDFYENESVAIVGESGSGKSVFTKTFAGMLETNGFISEGSIIFNDPELADTTVQLGGYANKLIAFAEKKLNQFAQLELGASIYNEMKALERDKKQRETMSEEEEKASRAEIDDLTFRRTEAFNLKQTIDSSKEKARYKAVSAEIDEMDKKIKELEKVRKATIAAHTKAMKNDTEYLKAYDEKMAQLKSAYSQAIGGTVSEAVMARNAVLAKEFYLSVGRYGFFRSTILVGKLLKAFKEAMRCGLDLNDDEVRNSVFDQVVFRVQYLDETENSLHGTCILNLAKVQYAKDWTQVRGGKIATVFQDPMTSLT